MITLYLIYKLMTFIISLSVWMLILPFRLILLPFRLLFGKPKQQKKKVNREEDAWWEGFLVGSIFWDD